MDPFTQTGYLSSPSGASTPFEVPKISLATPREHTVGALRHAALTSGFFQLVDIETYVSSELIVQMFDEARRFFQLPASEKAKVSLWFRRKDEVVTMALI